MATLNYLIKPYPTLFDICLKQFCLLLVVELKS